MTMSASGIKSVHPDQFASPEDDEEPLTLHADWTKEEEAKAKRK